MRYDDQILEQVRAANDIVDVISEYFPLKRAGRNFKARSPFTDEKTPSFMVSPEKQIFHCFSTGKGGDVFGFLMQYENLSFPEALRKLAERAHIQLPEKQAGARRDRPETEKIYDIYRYAAEYYAGILKHPEQGKAARKYLGERGFDQAIVDEFQLGWAPDAWQGLYEFLSKKGIPEDLLVKSRLVNKSDKGRVYDVFRGRLMFPIFNLQGKVVAFGGRILGQGEGPKYLNSPENPIFVKRRELFGLHSAKKFLKGDLPRILVVEGYFDYLRLHQKGFQYSVATLGTALTEEHVSVLKRFVQDVIVIYDGDKAGESASLRGLEVFIEGGLNVKLIQMPEGSDPDDFLAVQGPEAFQKLLDGALDFFDYKLRILTKRYNRNDSAGLVKISQEALDTLHKIKNPVLLDRYLRQLAQTLGVDENSLRTEMQRKAQAPGADRGRPAGDRASAVGAALGVRNKTRQSAEALLWGLAFDDPAFRDLLFREIEEDDLREKESLRLFRYLKEKRDQPEYWSLTRLMPHLQDESFKEALTGVTLFEWGADEKPKAFRDSIAAIKRQRREQRLIELRREISDAERQGQREALVVLTQEYQTLLREKT